MPRRPTPGYWPHYGDAYFRRLLASAPFERRPRGGWRFGTKLISDAVVFRLIANGYAKVDGDRVRPILQPAQICAGASLLQAITTREAGS